MKFLVTSIVVLVAAIILSSPTSYIRCHPSDRWKNKDEARKLFILADNNTDQQLTYTELESAFMSFDSDKDQAISTEEFLTKFNKDKYGSVKDALILFYNIDINSDRSITLDPDLKASEKFFDKDGDGYVNQDEFFDQYMKLSLEYDDTLVTNSTTIIIEE
ncbi:XP_029635129.1uncharacterized protein LOC115210628 [Octopus vulgaris]|uniref:XP_029635129.1uncharacterized protein LOC115210628 n=2 Tax=Octopus TaxID=6643 RepID=A0AA36EVH9_OCTVU|nr:uncharacterized protein LOC115210628 [Octopus sinensis]CAI9715761.1 XP_029635129.1uncharacterized protein LOC115210628 [Octopus vulgaris]